MLSDMTKGPWHVVAYGDGDSLVICEDEAGEKRIAFMAVPGARFEDERRKTWTRIKANAQAIAALPELIEALKAAVELVENGRLYEAQCCGGGYDCACQGSTYADELVDYIRDVLTKAGGPQ